MTRASSSITLAIARKCIVASRYYHLVHRLVVLKELKKVELNGKVCHVGGFDVESGRYAVHLRQGDRISEKRLAVKPENLETLKNGDSSASGSSDSALLVDRESRCGDTALQRVALDGTRDDIASFLLKHGADIDGGRLPPRRIAMSSAARRFITGRKDFPVDAFIARHVTKLDRKADPDVKSCAQCGREERKGSKDKFPACFACLSVCYCNRECQKLHR